VAAHAGVLARWMGRRGCGPAARPPAAVGPRRRGWM